MFSVPVRSEPACFEEAYPFEPDVAGVRIAFDLCYDADKAGGDG
jgi:hypothetical protein